MVMLAIQLSFPKDTLVNANFIRDKMVRTCFFCYSVTIDLPLKTRKIRLWVKGSFVFCKNNVGEKIAWAEGLVSLFYFFKQ
jgi:hypothetical protein